MKEQPEQSDKKPTAEETTDIYMFQPKVESPDAPKEPVNIVVVMEEINQRMNIPDVMTFFSGDWSEFKHRVIELVNKKDKELADLRAELDELSTLYNGACTNIEKLKAERDKLKEAIEGTLKFIDEEVLMNPEYSESPRLRLGASIVKIKLKSYLSDK